MTQQTGLSTTLCIATVDRPAALARTLACWQAGSVLPGEVRVADASASDETAAVCARSWDPLRVVYLRCTERSAALQRNVAAAGIESDLVLFCDDDVEPGSDVLERLIAVFSADADRAVGGVAGTIDGLSHPVPSAWLARYYRLQAGYRHEHYGGHFFGPAINLLPTDRPEDPELYPSQWLNTGLVAYRTELFQSELFPAYSGYSFGEDVNLSVRIGRTHRLFFHRGIRYTHRVEPAPYRRDARRLAQVQLENRWHNATQLLGLRGVTRTRKFLLGLAFETICLARERADGWLSFVAGQWIAFARLVAQGHGASNAKSAPDASDARTAFAAGSRSLPPSPAGGERIT